MWENIDHTPWTIRFIVFALADHAVEASEAVAMEARAVEAVSELEQAKVELFRVSESERIEKAQYRMGPMLLDADYVPAVRSSRSLLMPHCL
jgi:hypothetical protein